MKPRRCLATLGLLLCAGPALAAKILFIGNSFTYGHGSAVQYYRVETVTDLNGQGHGGVPALFKAFAAESGLPYEVSLETEPGIGLDWHLAHRGDVLGAQPWDAVVMHGYSTLDIAHPGDPTLLVRTATQMAQLLRRQNPAVTLYFNATWARADQVYPGSGAWHGRDVEAMTHEVRDGYAAAAQAIGAKAVAPVGSAWLRAMEAGLATRNPYEPLPPGEVDLWAFDHYHASAYGAYLEALVIFGTVTGRDPRALGDAECAGNELGLSREQVAKLQQIAFDELAQDLHIAPLPTPARPAAQPSCAALIGLHAADQRLRVPVDYQLVWSDEFDHPGLPDPRKWSYDTALNATGWDNHEVQYYARSRPANAEVKNGQLVITARHEDMRRAEANHGQQYSSARLLTRGHAAWTYGFFEVRAQLPCGKGTWPAIWLLNSAGRWPGGGEIDIMEQVGSAPAHVFSTLHTDAGWGANGVGGGTQLATACTAMHDYQLLWTPEELTFAVDGVVHHRYLKRDHEGAGWPFDQPEFLILNVAIGGDLGGAVDDAALPAAMRIEHVRVYQRQP